jgi:hypothetical protein
MRRLINKVIGLFIKDNRIRCIECWKKFETRIKWLWHLCSYPCRDAKYYWKEKLAANAKKYRPYKKYNCCICNKECTSIDDPRSRDAKYNKTCKSAECKKQNQRNLDNNANKNKRMKLHNEETFFSKKKELYSNLLIDYNSSPTGKAYIWLAKRPLMKNEEWFWYKWVILQSENRALIQCNECGDWYKLIPTSHLKTHWLTRDEYKLKYWLNKTQALVSDTYSMFYAENIIKVIPKNKINRPSNSFENYKRTRPVKYNTEQMKNNKWTCDLQLKTRFIDYLIWHHRYPPYNKYSYSSLKDRFWNINNALKEYWLPTREQKWHTILYHFEDWSVFKITRWKWYEDLYQMMVDKCPILYNQMKHENIRTR